MPKFIVWKSKSRRSPGCGHPVRPRLGFGGQDENSSSPGFASSIPDDCRGAWGLNSCLILEILNILFQSLSWCMGKGADVTVTLYTWANFPWRFSLPSHWIPKAVVMQTPLWVPLPVPRVSKPKWGSTELWAHLTVHSGEFLVWLLKNMGSVCLCILSFLPWGAVSVLWKVRDLLPIFLSLGVIFVVMPKVLPKASISTLWHEALPGLHWVFFSSFHAVPWPHQDEILRYIWFPCSAQTQACGNGFWFFLSRAGCWWMKSFVACYQPLQFTAAK